MKASIYKFCILAFLVPFCFLLFLLNGTTIAQAHNTGIAQTNSVALVQTQMWVDTTSLSVLLDQAREFAYNKGRVEARAICFKILARDSTYWDASVLIGRTYIWDSKHDSSRLVLSRVLVNKPGYYDAIDALIDNEYMADNYLDAVKYADEALLYHSDDDAFLYKKAKALNKLGKTKESSALLNRILVIDPSNKEAPALLLDIKRESRITKIAMSYSTDIFEGGNSGGDNPWNFASASIGRKTPHFGSVTLRYNFANRFGNNGHQLELDAYPAIYKGLYVYFSAGFSNKKNFPFSRISIEPYFKLPKSFEASIGVRYMNYDANRLFALDSNKIFIYTGTLGVYFGNYWLSVRPYFIKGVEAWSTSASLTLRRYFSDEDSYLSISIGTGVSPDEKQYAFDPGVPMEFLKSHKVSLDYQQKFGYRFVLGFGAGYALEEIRADVMRNRFSLNVGISYLF